MTSAAAKSLIDVRGQPPRFQAALTVDAETESFCDLHLDLPEAAAGGPPLIAQILAGPGRLRFLTFLLAAWTPPGRYTGEVRLGDGWHPIGVTVEEHPSLRLIPTRLEATVNPGGDLIAELTVANVGNVAYELTRSHVVGLTAADALDRALSRTSIAALSEGENPAFRFAAELFGARGGATAIRVREGAGSVEPGEARRVRITVHIPERLQGGRTYIGTWRLGDSGFAMRITAAGHEARDDEDDDRDRAHDGPKRSPARRQRKQP